MKQSNAPPQQMSLNLHSHFDSDNTDAGNLDKLGGDSDNMGDGSGN